MPDHPPLTLAHSPDPDDAFMWWPITGMTDRAGAPLAGEAGRPAIDTGGFTFRALPRDIAELNRAAASDPDPPAVTALSVRAWADVRGRYALAACGGSFGEGYGPRLVCREDSSLHCEGCVRGQKPVIAIPGERTTAYLVLSLAIGQPMRVVEMPFDRIEDAVASGEVGAGLLIHEGQLTHGDRGLRLLLDLGAWWQKRASLPLPLGVTGIRRDLEGQRGEGTIARVSRVLRASIEHAIAGRERSLEHAARFTTGPTSRARVERYVDMYVNRRTVDMGEEGREAIRRLLAEGARAGLCPAVERVETV